MSRTKLLAAFLPAVLTFAFVQESKPAKIFAHDTIHFGIVVSDIEAAVAFYGGVLGLAEREGFSVPAELCTAAGLTDDEPLQVRVFATSAENKDATMVKLMTVPGVTSRDSDNTFIHSQLGISYLTIRVSDLDASLARVRAAGGAVLAKGPVPLGDRPESDQLAVVRDPDGNLIELIGPRH